MDNMVKLCRSCHQDEEHALRPGGQPQTWCKKCQRGYSKAHYEKNKTNHNQRRQANKAEQVARMREVVNGIKSVPCMDCVVPYPTYVMHFDHRDPSTKKFSISNFASCGATMETLLEEMSKCDVVCSNCHAERTFGGK